MEIEERFQNKEKIGKGTYGIVYKAHDNKLQRIVAYKKMILQMDNEGIPSTALREISLLKGLKHPNIVDLLDIILQPNKIILIFEYMQQDLKQFLENHSEQQLQIPHLKKFMFQLLQGLVELHSRRIIHRDLKPQNILMDSDQNLKIADFGLARTFSIPTRPYTDSVVTLLYRAPEILLGAPEYSTPIDIWALGCIFFEMITKQPMICGENENDQIYKMFRILGTPTEQIWPGVDNFKNFASLLVPSHERKSLKEQFSKMNLNIDELGLDLLERMLVYDPAKRITAKSALEHPWFYEIQFINNHNIQLF